MTLTFRNDYGYAYVWLLQHTWGADIHAKIALINTLIYLAKRSD